MQVGVLAVAVKLSVELELSLEQIHELKSQLPRGKKTASYVLPLHF